MTPLPSAGIGLRSESVKNARKKLKTIDLVRIHTHIVYHAHRINTW